MRERGRRLRNGKRGAIHITAAILVIIIAVAVVAAVFGGWFAFNVWPDAPGQGTTYTYNYGFTATTGAAYYEYSVSGSPSDLTGASLVGSSAPFNLGALSGPTGLCSVSYAGNGAPIGSPISCPISSGNTLVVSLPKGSGSASEVLIGGKIVVLGHVGPEVTPRDFGCMYVPPGC